MPAFLISIIFGLISGLAIGFSISFFIFSLMLNRSNNFGDEKVLRPIGKLKGFDSEVKVFSKADRINRDQREFQMYVDSGMRQLIQSPEYQQSMARSIKSPDDEQVSTRGL